MEDLQMGASILKEYITLEVEKQDRAARAKKSEKAAHDAAAERVTDTIFIIESDGGADDTCLM
jgi:hypothetical protein